MRRVMYSISVARSMMGTVTAMNHGFVRFAFLVFLIAISGCHRTVSHSIPGRPSASRATDDCKLISEPGEPIGKVALNERVDPANAPHPSNESERLVFRQLYETLVRVDCMK